MPNQTNLFSHSNLARQLPQKRYKKQSNTAATLNLSSEKRNCPWDSKNLNPAGTLWVSSGSLWHEKPIPCAVQAPEGRVEQWCLAEGKLQHLQLWLRGCLQQGGPSGCETEHPRGGSRMSGLEAVLLSFALKGKKNIWNIYSEPLEKKKHRTPQWWNSTRNKGTTEYYTHTQVFTWAPLHCSTGHGKHIN